MNYLPLQDPHEIRVDEESKLTLHGLLQYYVKLTEKVGVGVGGVGDLGRKIWDLKKPPMTGKMVNQWITNG